MSSTAHVLSSRNIMSRFFVCILVVTLALLARPAAAEQDGIDRGYGVDAFWSYTNGCTETFVGIYAAAFTSVGAQIEQRDVCSNPPTLLLSAFSGQGQIQPEDALTVNAGLSKAELHATVNVCDSVSGNCFPLSIDLVHDRVGGIDDCSQDSPTPLPPPQGVYSIACSTVVTGTVIGTVNGVTTNFTPIPGYGVIELHRGFAN